MTNVMLNPISTENRPSVPMVLAPQAVSLGTSVLPNGTDFNNSELQTLAIQESANFTEPMASDNNGQMDGFVSYLNQGPQMHPESGSMSNLADTLGFGGKKRSFGTAR